MPTMAGVTPEPSRRSRRAVVIIAGGALAGALVLQAFALAAGGRELRAGTSGPAIISMLLTAAFAAGLGWRWARLRWPAVFGTAVAATAASLGVASAMVLVGWLTGFYHPDWTVF